MFKSINSIRRRHIIRQTIPYHSYSFISTAVDKAQLCQRAKIKQDGDRTEKKVNVIYINNQILELEQLGGTTQYNTTSTCKIS